MVYKYGDYFQFSFNGGSIRTAFYTKNVNVYGRDKKRYKLIYGKDIEQ